MLVLLVGAYIERRVRFILAKSDQIIGIVGKHKTDKPTIKAILDMLSTVDMVYVRDGGGNVVSTKQDLAQSLAVHRSSGHRSDIHIAPMLRQPKAGSKSLSIAWRRMRSVM